MQIEAFGEEKSLTAWAEDKRCVVSFTTLRSRVRRGWETERALRTPQSKTALYDAFGERKTVSEWATDGRCLVRGPVLRKRLAAGWDVEEALGTSTEPATLQAFNETKTVVAWAADARCAVSLKTLRRRLTSGMDPEQALTGAPKKGASYVAFGERKTLVEWGNDVRCHCSYEALKSRLERGWAFSEALTLPLVSASYEAFGEVKHISEWELDERCVISGDRLYQRVHSGWDVEGAITIPLNTSSVGERQVGELLAAWGFETARNVRDVIPPLEFDIYIPALRVAVEFNGVFWHSERFKHRNYHRDKRRAAEDAGIRLVQIWEDVWKERQESVTNHLRSLLGVNSAERFDARKCIVKPLTHTEAAAFLEKHHIQGEVRASTHLGLYATGHLVAVCSFTRRTEEVHELVRFATVGRVRGGFSKLVKAYQRIHPTTKLESFAALDTSVGHLYYSTGWKCVKELPPEYTYVRNNRREHKFKFRKARFRDDNSLVHREGLTELQLAALNGIERCWDSGKLKFSLPPLQTQ